MNKPLEKNLTPREKIVIWLFLWIINIISPWEFNHQQTEWINNIKQCLKGEPND